MKTKEEIAEMPRRVNKTWEAILKMNGNMGFDDPKWLAILKDYQGR